MALPPEVCIRGAGIVGRALALLLARERIRVALVAPPAANAVPDIRAYALNAASKALLESLHAWPDQMHCTAVQGMQVFGDHEGQINFNAAAQNVPALAWIVDVPALEQQLDEALRFAPQLQRLDEPVDAPLTVVCEGRASATRAALGVRYDTIRYPQHAIAARLQSQLSHGGVARQWFTQVEGRGEVLALLPMGGNSDAHELALVWSVNQWRAPALQALDADAFGQALREATRDALGTLTLVTERAAWPLTRAMAARWSGKLANGNAWALAGDAAHAVHPLAGQGLNLGLADAACLAETLKAREYWRGVGDARLLRRYERARRAQVQAMSLATDALAQLFSHDTGPLPQVRNWGLSGVEQMPFLKHWLARQAMGLERA